MAIEEFEISLPKGERERVLRDTTNERLVGVAALSHPTTGALVPPASSDYQSPIAGYELSDYTDESVSPQYMGFVNASGAWFIKQLITSTDPRTIRFESGESDYSTGWAGRAAGTYVTFDAAF
jgi:hypothetical protein